MSRVVIVGIAAEGPTDLRFLESVVERSFQDIAFHEFRQEYTFAVEVLNGIDKSGPFPVFVEKACRSALEQIGAMTVVIHTDSDKFSYAERYENKFVPALQRLQKFESDDNLCHVITPLIPVHMIESWMLADKALFRKLICTDKTDAELNIDGNVETFADPKQKITEAIRIANAGHPKSFRNVSIAELYGIIGQSVSLDALKRLDSYRSFCTCVLDTLRCLNCH